MDPHEMVALIAAVLLAGQSKELLGADPDDTKAQEMVHTAVDLAGALLIHSEHMLMSAPHTDMVTRRGEVQ